MPNHSGKEIPPLVHDHIDAIIEAEQIAHQTRSFSEVIYEFIGGLIGTLSFVVAQLIGVALWVAINADTMPAIHPFDPYPYHFLDLILTVEGVLVAAFVLMKQNRMSKLADKRAHLDLQINLLTERETTKIIGILLEISERLNIQHKVLDEESRQLSRLLTIEALIETLHKKFPEQ